MLQTLKRFPGTQRKNVRSEISWLNIFGLGVIFAMALMLLGASLPIMAQAPPPLATITASPTCGDAPLNVCFTADSSDLNPDAIPWTYDWNFGDGTYPTPNFNDPAPCHAFMTPNTTYSVTVQITDTDGTVANGSTSISTDPLIVSACVDVSSGPAPLLVQWNNGCGSLSGGVGPFSVEIDFGDGSQICTDWKTQHAYDTPGTYYTSVKVTDSCDPPEVVTDTHIVITVTQLSVSANATADRLCGPPNTQVCFNGSATGGVGPYTYTWDFGDGSPLDYTASPCHTYISTGVYTVTMTARDSLGSTATDSHLQIAITKALSATASASRITGFAPFTVYFTSSVTGGTGPYTYLWDFGDGGSSTEASPTHVYAAEGTYDVTLTVKDSCSPAATAVDDHLVMGVYPILVTVDVNLSCGYAPLNAVFSGTAVGGIPPYTYSWDFGDGSPLSTELNPSHSYQTPGDYMATLTVTDSNSQSAVGTVDISVTDPLVVTVAGSPATTGLAPLTVDLSSTITGGTPPYTYDWDFGDGSTHAAAPSAQHAWVDPGDYDVTLTVSDSCDHSSTETLTIKVVEAPTIELLSPQDGGQYGGLVDFQSAVYDDVAVSRVEYYVDGNYIGSAVTDPYSFSWNSGGLYETASVYAKVYDVSGRTAVTPTITINLWNPTLTGKVSRRKSPFRLKIFGANLEPGCVVLINGTPAPYSAYKTSSVVVAKRGRTLKAMLPKGVPVSITVNNPDGGISNAVTYTR